MFFFVSLIWWLDRYDREPLWLIAVTFAWGALGAVLLAVPLSLGMQGVVAAVGTVLPPDRADAWTLLLGTAIVAPLIEEPAKALVLPLVSRTRHFDNTADGFVYGAVAGLGFGMTENFIYFLGQVADPSSWGTTVMIRTFYSALMHGTASACVGAAIGYGRFRPPLHTAVIALCGLGAGTLVHATWNGLLVAEHLWDAGGTLYRLDLLLFPFELASAFGLFEACVLAQSSSIRRELRAESARGLLPIEHADAIASWWHRLKADWTPPGVDHDLYVVTATQLAQRLVQARRLGPRAPAFYRDEIERLRAQLLRITAPPLPTGPHPPR
jgi:RsiW-degrading membrane proteinase PrsW (M82 family)